LFDFIFGNYFTVFHEFRRHALWIDYFNVIAHLIDTQTNAINSTISMTTMILIKRCFVILGVPIFQLIAKRTNAACIALPLCVQCKSTRPKTLARRRVIASKPCAHDCTAVLRLPIDHPIVLPLRPLMNPVTECLTARLQLRS
jgi:hypothetical protein